MYHDEIEMTKEDPAALIARMNKSQMEQRAMEQVRGNLTDPLEVQLLSHFRTLSAYGKKVAVHQMAAAASLCRNCKES